jgi:hypothetical protein
MQISQFFVTKFPASLGDFVSVRICPSVGIVIRLQPGQPRSRGSIPSMGKKFVSSPHLQTGSEANRGTCRLDTGACFPGDEAAGALN